MDTHRERKVQDCKRQRPCSETATADLVHRFGTVRRLNYESIQFFALNTSRIRNKLPLRECALHSLQHPTRGNVKHFEAAGAANLPNGLAWSQNTFYNDKSLLVKKCLYCLAGFLDDDKVHLEHYPSGRRVFSARFSHGIVYLIRRYEGKTDFRPSE